MKNFLTPTGTSSAAPRLTRWIFAAILAGVAIGCGPQPGQAPQPGQVQQPGPLPQGPQGPQASPWPQNGPAPQAAPASESSVVGQWRTVMQANIVTITIQANGQYMQLEVPQNGGMKFAQGGPYQLIAPNIIAFTVTDWSPKSRMIFVPCGIANNPVCNTQQEQDIPQPPNSSYAYRFNGPNTMILSNPNTREVLTFTRVTAP